MPPFKNGLRLFTLSTLLFSTASFSSDYNYNPASLFSLDCSSFVVSVSGGSSWVGAGRNQTVFFTPNIVRTYTAPTTNQHLPIGELFVGIQNPLPYDWKGQIGLAFVSTGNARLSGHIWDNADPQFDNFTYRYKVRHTHIALKGKLLLGDCNYILIPWVSVAIGVASNKTYDFSTRPTNLGVPPTPSFTSKTKTALTYAIGGGFQKQFCHHWQVGIGYEFAGWGKSLLGHAPGAINGQTLSLAHVYTNSLLVNLTYLS